MWASHSLRLEVTAGRLHRSLDARDVGGSADVDAGTGMRQDQRLDAVDRGLAIAGAE